ncbi:MAG TPA: hypothetical protein VFA34_10710 [Actinomycetota bacterium]|nr:hypothetical protein [Actinomycetota bacterium]
MHALRHVHELLVPGGTMLDLHPVTEEQVEASGRRIGVIDDPEFRVDLPNAEARLAEAIRDGLYALEAELEFDVLQHVDTVEELFEKRDELLTAQPALADRIRAVKPPLVIREHVVFRRLLRADP